MPPHQPVPETAWCMSPESALVSYFRCPPEFSKPAIVTDVAETEIPSGLMDLDRAVNPLWDLDEFCRVLRNELYAAPSNRPAAPGPIRRGYYAVRPLLPVAVRKHMQRLALRGWDQIPFPRWPVDVSVDAAMWRALELASRVSDEPIPFIWFWPEGHRACCIITHDVETTGGRDYCRHLMDLAESRGLRSSFQVVPEKRYDVPADFLAELKERRFEVNVHGLNHDGHLFDNYTEFATRIRHIADYAAKWQARGFRAPVMYRNARWMHELPFEYDMSFPNVAHLDPQRGGCCTVMPYFFGNVVELPLTTTQDYSLFHIIKTYSTVLWQRQIDMAIRHHGLVTVSVHPDYVREPAAHRAFENLLELLADRCFSDQVWTSLPGQAAEWWRQRAQMVLVPDGSKWRIEGAGSERARLAYASFDGRRFVVRFDNGRSVYPETTLQP